MIPFGSLNAQTRCRMWRRIARITMTASLVTTVLLLTPSIGGESVAPFDPQFTRDPDESVFPFALNERNDSLDPRESIDNSKIAWKTPFGQLDWNEIRSKLYLKDGRYFVNHNGFVLKLTLNPALHRSIQDNVSAQKRVAAAVVMLESTSGKILALAEQNSNPELPLYGVKNSILFSAQAPAASLMKIVTATAAIEKTGMDPADEILFNGGCGKLRNENWLRDEKRDQQKLTFAKAFGTSCNTVFARIALYKAGLSSLKNAAERTYFNKAIPSDIRIESSAASIPPLESATPLEVGELGAGFGNSKLSPVHAAMLSATVGNHGVMMAPYLVETAWDSTGKEVYQAKPQVLSKVFSVQTSQKLISLMRGSVVSGTSRRYFKRKGTSRDRDEIGGKTGTLCDAEDRRTLYTWFSGLAPLDQTENVAIGTLVASPQNWVVRASAVAQLSLADYLRVLRKESRLAEGGSLK